VLTFRELELTVCGKTDVDIDLLRRHTRYNAVEQLDYQNGSDYIEMFWSVLKEEFTESERIQFVKFCWGQARLPQTDQAFI